MILLSVVGILTVPLLPWAILTVQVTEGSEIRTETCYLDKAALDSSRVVGCSNPRVGALPGDLGLVNLGFWWVLVLGALAHLGTMVHESGGERLSGPVLILLGNGAVIGAVLALLGQLLFVADLPALEASVPQSAQPAAVFGYNYAPSVVAVLMVLVTVAYAVRLSPFAFTRAAELMSRPPDLYASRGGTGAYPSTAPPPPLPPEDGGSLAHAPDLPTCPYCAAQILPADGVCTGCGLPLWEP